VLWFFIMGLFTRGGRGWCNFLCPAGALMGLTHRLGVKLRISRQVTIDRATCTNCKKCAELCPAWAISTYKLKPAEINYQGCNTCLDCTKVCPTNSIRYGGPAREERSEDASAREDPAGSAKTARGGGGHDDRDRQHLRHPGVSADRPMRHVRSLCARLPLLALPLAADAVVMLAGGSWEAARTQHHCKPDGDSTASSS